ncbi:HAD-IA family hydrolase [bacterium]|nr:HAD-IA family hydrolase [bacterium]
MNAIEKEKYLRKKFGGRAISATSPEKIEKTKLVVFDFDETLVHSKEMFDNVNRRAMETLNLPHTEDIVKNAFNILQTEYVGWGKNFEDQVHIFKTRFNDTVVKLCNQDEFVNQVRFYNGMRNVIKQLAKTDVALAIASSRDLHSILKFLRKEKMLSYFEMIQATEGGKKFRDKPDTQIVNYISQEIGIPSTKAIMIGDTKGDIKMGRDMGMKTIGIGYGRYSSLDEMKNNAPNAIVSSTKEIKNIPAIVNFLLNER